MPLPPHTCSYFFFSLFPYFILFPSTSHSTPECSTHFKPLSHPSVFAFFFFFFDSSKANDDEEEDEDDDDDDDDDDEEVYASLFSSFFFISLFPYFIFTSLFLFFFFFFLLSPFSLPLPPKISSCRRARVFDLVK